MTVRGSCTVEWGLLVTVSQSLCPVEGPVRSRVLSLAAIVAQKFDCQLFDISPSRIGCDPKLVLLDNRLSDEA